MPLNITTGRVPKPRRTVIYGPGGVGKSTFCASCPDGIFIPVEEGANDIDVAKLDFVTSFGQCLEHLAALYTEDHPFRAVTIDSLDWLERLIWAEYCQEKGLGSMEERDYGKSYLEVLPKWSELLRGLDALRDARGMAVFLIAHSKTEKFEDPETASYDRYCPKLHKSATAMIVEWADEVLFANVRTLVSTEKGAFGKATTKAKTTGDRILRCSNRPQAVAKNRLGLPDEVALDWAVYSQFIPV